MPEFSNMPYRTLGRTGARVSAIGLGGWHIGLNTISDALSMQIVRAAIDRGINFFDNSWDYNDGASETRMGKALRDGYRQKVFLMTKIDGRSKSEAARQLDESLRRLQTDCIDLVQHHEMLRFEDPHRIFDDEGAQAALLEARQAGKLRFIGFTGHKDPRIHLHTLEVASEHGFTFDTVQMPLNVMDAHYRSFARLVVPELVKQNIGVLGMTQGSTDPSAHARGGPRTRLHLRHGPDAAERNGRGRKPLHAASSNCSRRRQSSIRRHLILNGWGKNLIG